MALAYEGVKVPEEEGTLERFETSSSRSLAKGTTRVKRPREEEEGDEELDDDIVV